ncbi:hypothetical protein ACO0SA_002382 [Hanseniaspora valbyensis]
MSDQNINIDTALDLLNNQINSIEKRINIDEDESKKNKLYISINQFDNQCFNESDEEEEDEDSIMDTTITSYQNNYKVSDNKLSKIISNQSNISRNSHSSILPADAVLNNSNSESARVPSLPNTTSFLFNNSYSRRNSNETISNNGIKNSFGLSRNNSRLKSGGTHSYLDSSCNNTTNSSNISSPFMKQANQFGNSPFLSNNSSPFNKHQNSNNNNNYHHHLANGILHNNNGNLNNNKRSSQSNTSSFKSSVGLKRTTSLKKYNNSNNANLNIYCNNNTNNNYIGINSNSSNSNNSNLITNLQSRLELDLKHKQQQQQQQNINKQRDGENEEDPYDFISKQPPPAPFLIPYSNNGNNQIPVLSSSNTGSSINSTSSNNLGLFVIDSDDSKEDQLSNKYLDIREDLNKTPTVQSNSKMPPKTPERTNNLLYKLNTDLNFETESMEVMSAMSQTSLASNPNGFKKSNSMIFDKYDLLKMSNEVSSSFIKENPSATEGEIEDHRLKQIIHLPTLQDKFTYNQDGITLISSDFLKKMILETKNKNSNDLLIIDCRFPKEYAKGRIRNSINIYDFENLVDLLKKLISNSSIKELVRYKIVLYCEFSQYRSPKMGKFLRKLDRLINIKYWPYLIFPDLFILEGGIYNFKELNQSLMTGKYCSMDDSYLLDLEELETNLNIFRNKVDLYLGSNNKNESKNNVNSGFASFDKMVDLKNDLMKVINNSF